MTKKTSNIRARQENIRIAQERQVALQQAATQQVPAIFTPYIQMVDILRLAREHGTTLVRRQTATGTSEDTLMTPELVLDEIHRYLSTIVKKN